MLTTDYSDIGYRKIRAKLILKDTVEKHTIVIPLFIVLLAFFCSEKTARSSFPYHFLFTATGDAKQRSMERGDVSLFKLFNQLLDESLLPEQFNKCLSIIYNESFRLHQTEIDDLFLQFRERVNPIPGDTVHWIDAHGQVSQYNREDLGEESSAFYQDGDITLNP